MRRVTLGVKVQTMFFLHKQFKIFCNLYNAVLQYIMYLY